MNKAENLSWFNEVMKSKMLKHPEDPCAMNYIKLLDWLREELKELDNALSWESKTNVILECADVANLAYFIADKIKRGL